MINIGVGNAGSSLLWRFALEKGVHYVGSLRAIQEHRFTLVDADSHDGIIHLIKGIEKLRTKAPSDGIHILQRGEFWSGGCGVYHTLGELLAGARAGKPNAVAAETLSAILGVRAYAQWDGNNGATRFPEETEAGSG
jgi:hypothetical protein